MAKGLSYNRPRGKNGFHCVRQDRFRQEAILHRGAENTEEKNKQLYDIPGSHFGKIFLGNA